MRQRFLIILAVIFFLGFPMLGLVFVWKYAHGNIEKSAGAAAQTLAHEALTSDSLATVDELGTLTFRKGKDSERFLKDKAALGKLVSVEGWKVGKSSVGQRDDVVWQLVYCNAVAKFEKGEADLNILVARRTMNPEWRIDEIQLRRR